MDLFYPRYHEYMEWLFNKGMYTVFSNQNSEEILSQTVPEPVEDVANLGYVSDAILQVRAVSILIFLFNILFYFIVSRKLSFKYIIFL